MQVFEVVLLVSLALASTTAQDDIPEVKFLMPPVSSIPWSQVVTGGGRIINGAQASKGMFPYQVGIDIALEKGYTWCGGSVISDQYVLTAAHCIYTALSVNVILGANDRASPNEIGQKRIYVSKTNFKVHEGWSSSTLRDDIALIKTPTKIVFTDYIKPIALPTRIHELYSDFTGFPSVATGWGFTAGSSALARYLQYVNATIQDQNVCIGYLKPWVQPSNICMDGSAGKGACYGDSGSPLASTTSQKYILGIASFIGYDGCESKWPSVYTRVSSYLDWITLHTGIAIK